jgi:hypothetical protein
MRDSTDYAEHGDKSPEKGSGYNMQKLGLRIRQKVNAPGDHGKADYQAGMVKNKQGRAAFAPSQIDKGSPEEQRGQSRRLFEKHQAENPHQK